MSKSLPPADDKGAAVPFHGAQWLGMNRPELSPNAPPLPAPCFRRVFTIPDGTRNILLHLAAPGWCDAQIDGAPFTPYRLYPAPTIFDRRVRFVTFDLESQLAPGTHVFSIVLGNGWYNCPAKDEWDFCHAPWRDNPKFMMALECNGKAVLKTEPGWKCSEGALRRDSLRNGEFADFNFEPTGWRKEGFDDTTWEEAIAVPPPGGVMSPQLAPGCVTSERLDPVAATRLPDGTYRFDFGQVVSGVCAITVSGAAGCRYCITYFEELSPDGQDVNGHQERLGQYVHSGTFQQDTLVAATDDPLAWEPQLVFHGFRYVLVRPSMPEGRVDAIQAGFIHTELPRRSSITCSDADFTRLLHCADYSYRGNFIGFPSDCPQREKNGWTGDACLACETGLYSYHAIAPYREFLETLCDAQRPSGQVPVIVPTGGWGYNNRLGPAWDMALFELPYRMALHSRNAACLTDFIGPMTRLLEYETSLCTDHIFPFGLGDWCAPANQESRADRRLVSTLYCAEMMRILAFALELAHDTQQAESWRKRRNATLGAIRTKFVTDGILGNGTPTEIALALGFGLFKETEARKWAECLAEKVRGNGHRACFGMLGAKFVPRALARHGFLDDAWKLFHTRDYPSWGAWLEQGATTLWENWEGSQSHNHAMFCDFVAWAYEFIGGLRFDEEYFHSGCLTVTPALPQGLDSFKWHCYVDGGKAVSCDIRRVNGEILCDLKSDIPSRLA